MLEIPPRASVVELLPTLRPERKSFAPWRRQLVAGVAPGRAWTRAGQRTQTTLEALPEQPLLAIRKIR